MANNQDQQKSVKDEKDITNNLEKQNSDESPIFSILPQFFDSNPDHEYENFSFSSFEDWSRSTVACSSNESNTSFQFNDDLNQTKMGNDLKSIEKSMVAIYKSRPMTKTDGAETKSTSRMVANTGIEQVINSTSNSNMDIDKQRQWIILTLLEQVTSLHDVHVTPQTFAIHVLHLLENKILEPSTVRYLFEYHGLIPKNWNADAEINNHSVSDRGVNHEKNTESQTALTINQERDIQLTLIRQYFLGQSSSPTTTIEPSAANRFLIQNLSLATHNKSNNNLFQSYLRNLNHPLLTSRSQRDYFYPDSSLPLSSGSFGSVYHVRSKLDSVDYALKQIYFENQLHFVTNSENNTKAIDLTLREVKCLAQLNHPHCVRYYTSWLEPCWNTRHHHHENQWNHNLLENKPSDHDHLYLANPKQTRNQNESFTKVNGNSENHSISIGEYGDDSDSDYSEWSRDLKSSSSSTSSASSASFVFSSQESSNRSYTRKVYPKKGNQRQIPVNYHQKATTFRYEICLYIQMELCSFKTLADWIHDRNHNTNKGDDMNDNDQIVMLTENNQYDDIEESCYVNNKCYKKHMETAFSQTSQKTRVHEALIIMKQIASGLEHVHSKQIIHRDLKPANIFCSKDDSNFFKIGDFGLSKPLFPSNVEKNSNNGNQDISSFYKEKPQVQDLIKLEQTIGVGTVSYASPEQISSSSYDTQADIFSLGLIFLELLGNYKTTHERSNAFHAIRKERKVLLFLELPSNNFKNDGHDSGEVSLQRLEKLILDMTDIDPKKRPIASKVLELIEKEIMAIEYKENENFEFAKEIVEPDNKLKEFKDKLREKDMIIKKQQMRIYEMEQIIVNLKKQVRENANN